MKQANDAKYSVAWFKLADFVHRGDKERALGIYKLLMHTIDDVAFAHQLEGDLLLAFGDVAAFEKYIRAAEQYRERGQFIQAAALYEHMVDLAPKRYDLQVQLVSIYLQYQPLDKVQNHVDCIVKQVEQDGELLTLLSVVETEPLDVEVKVLLQKRIDQSC